MYTEHKEKYLNWSLQILTTCLLGIPDTTDILIIKQMGHKDKKCKGKKF